MYRLIAEEQTTYYCSSFTCQLQMKGKIDHDRTDWIIIVIRF